MIDYYVKLVGVEHVRIASDDIFTTKPTMDFVARNSSMYADGGYKCAFTVRCGKDLLLKMIR